MITIKKIEEIDLNKLSLDDIDKDRKLLAKQLIEELIFVKKTLTECKKIVSEQGAVEVFTQGAYSYNRETPAVKIYNSSIKNYCILMKQLVDLLPKQERKQFSEETMKLIQFMNE